MLGDRRHRSSALVSGEGGNLGSSDFDLLGTLLNGHGS